MSDKELLHRLVEFALAGFAGADHAEVFVAVDAGFMAVCEFELNGVIADGFGVAGFGLGLKQGQNRRPQRQRSLGGGMGSSSRWMTCGRRFGFGFASAVVFAIGAGAEFAEIGEIVMARVAIGPDYVHARAGGDVDLDALGLLANV